MHAFDTRLSRTLADNMVEEAMARSQNTVKTGRKSTLKQRLGAYLIERGKRLAVNPKTA